jgi:hypothetical protein
MLLTGPPAGGGAGEIAWPAGTAEFGSNEASEREPVVSHLLRPAE